VHLVDESCFVDAFGVSWFWFVVCGTHHHCTLTLYSLHCTLHTALLQQCPLTQEILIPELDFSSADLRRETCVGMLWRGKWE
jgi:hypothetical protein